MTILLTLNVEALFILKVDLSTVRAVLMLNPATACVYLLMNILMRVRFHFRTAAEDEIGCSCCGERSG